MLNNEIDLSFNYEPITYREIKDGKGRKPTEYQKRLLDNVIESDMALVDINQRLNGRTSCFTDRLVWDDKVMPTIVAGGKTLSAISKVHVSDTEIIKAQSFPEDYNFCNEKVRYICGMSVPPIMIKRVVTRLIESGVFEK